MKTGTLLTLLTLSFVLAAPPAAWPQAGTQSQAPTASDAEDWQGLSGLEPGRRIWVEFKDADREPLRGKFVRAAGGRLFLSFDGDTLSLERRDIGRVYRVKGRWSRGKAAGVGAGVGMLIGTWIGTGIGLRNERRPGHVPSDADMTPAFVGFGIGTAAGAGAGALIGGRRKGELLYESK